VRGSRVQDDNVFQGPKKRFRYVKAPIVCIDGVALLLARVGRLRWVDHQAYRESGSFAQPAFDGDRSPVQLGQLLDEGQAEAGTTVFLRNLRRTLVERLEDSFMIFGRNANARVGDGYVHIVIDLHREQFDVTSIWSEFDRVTEEVEDYLLDPTLICGDDQVGCRILDSNLEELFFRARSILTQDSMHSYTPMGLISTSSFPASILDTSIMSLISVNK